MSSTPAVPRFRWISSFMSVTEYEVRDETGVYRIRCRQGVSDYERSIYNGTPEAFQREVVAAIGKICRCGDPSAPVPASTVDAFNAWRLLQHQEFVARLQQNPTRYGSIDADDPMLAAPPRLEPVIWTSAGWSHL